MMWAARDKSKAAKSHRHAAFAKAGHVTFLCVAIGVTSAATAQTAVPGRAPTQKPAAVSAHQSTQSAQQILRNEDIVARVGSTDITAEEVKAFVNSLGAREQMTIERDPALLSQTVRLMLANQLVLKEALEKKWEQQPAVSAQLEQLRKTAIVESYLQSVSTPPASFPNEAEIEKAYEANKSAFLVPRQFKIAQIFVALGKDADKATEEKARKKLAEIEAKLRQAGTDYAALAKAESEDSVTAAQGGELGWLPENQIKPEIKTQVMGLAVNTISEPVKLDDGWHILKLLDTKAAYTRPLNEVRDFLVQRLRAQSAEANRRAYLAKVLERSPPAINEIALSKVFGSASQADSR